MVALTQTILDDFGDGSHGANWSNWGGAFVTETTGILNISTGSTSSAFYGIDWTPDVNLDGVYIGSQIVATGATHTGLEVYPAVANINSTNGFYWLLNRTTGNASCWTRVNNIYIQRGSAFVYSLNTHFAVGVNGSNLEWVYSTDGTNFTVQATHSNPYGTTTATSFTIQVGMTTAPFPPKQIQFDNFSTWASAAIDLDGTGDPITATGALTSTGLKGGVGTGTAISASAVLDEAPGTKAVSGTGAPITAQAILTGSGGATGSNRLGTGATIQGVLTASVGTGFKAGSGTGIALSADASLSVAQGERGAIYLIPPATPTGAFHDGVRRWRASDLWRFYGFSQGLAIVKINGLWTTTTAVSLDEVEEFYQGGMKHTITVEKAEELVAAGFGEYISG